MSQIREQIRVNIPPEWIENMKHGRCWCGKIKSEFDKNQKFYCSQTHADEYSKRITYWSNFREEILTEQGEECVKCGMTDKKFDKIEEKRKHDHFMQLALKYPQAVFESRAIMLKELQEKYQQIMDDAYAMEHLHYKIEDRHLTRDDRYFDKRYFGVEVDHIIAVALGGDMWDKKNMQVLCRNCHAEKTKNDMVKIKENKNDHAKTNQE